MATTQLVTSDPVKSIEEYKKILGVSNNNFTPEGVLKSFEISHWVKKENGELDTIGPIVDAKNKLIQHFVSSQMEAKRYFEITSPFENSCIACHGTGEIYKFERKTVLVNCHICGGSGQIMDTCPTCNGSKRYIEHWKGGGGINVACKKCGGTGKVPVSKCIECLGEGKKKKMVTSHIIQSTTPCKRCQQLGFTNNIIKPKMKKPVKSNKFHNPVLSTDLAKKIQKVISMKKRS